MVVSKRQVKHLGYRCVGPTITLVKIEKLKTALRNDKRLTEAKKHFSILSGETRMKILYLLLREKELCVRDMADILETTVSAVSHQLKILRKNEFVESRKNAQTVFYSLTSKSRKQLQSHI